MFLAANDDAIGGEQQQQQWEKQKKKKKEEFITENAFINLGNGLRGGGEGDEEGSEDRHCTVQFSPTVHSTTSTRFFTLFLPGEEREKGVS